MPSHHQRDFFDELNLIFDEVAVFYYGAVDNRRKSEGWKELELRNYEYYVKKSEISDVLSKFKDYHHIIPRRHSAYRPRPDRRIPRARVQRNQEAPALYRGKG